MSESIEVLLHENRQFAPSAEFVAQANMNDPAIYERAAAGPVAFWSEWANTLDWMTPWTTALEWNLPDAKWFTGGTLNACDNCVDRHVRNGLGDKTAIIFEGEPGDTRRLTYRELQDEVSRIANALKAMGVKKGDRVCIYLPMVPELPMTMLACARIGAAHSVVFGGFSAESVSDRINDSQCSAVVTADGGWRRGTVVQLKKITNDALAMGCPSINKVLVLERVGSDLAPDANWVEGRDVRWSDLVPAQSTDCPCEPMDSEDLLFVLYTSGSTGKPKGIMHSTAGYLTGITATANWVFDLKPNDVYWCTADCGWVTGHSYLTYGPLSNAATVVVYEGAPDTPDKDRFWRIIERHGVTILYTAPTAIRTFMKWGTEYPDRCDLTSLRLLGSVGEPINPEAWIWYHENIGGGRCPIVDTWWQTETGGIMISPLPGLVATKPGSATRAFPGIQVCVMDENGNEVVSQPGEEHGGILAITHPWPSMARGIYGDPQRFLDVYWSRFPGKYFPGDGVKVDADGYIWLLGRVDDIMLVAGHNISTMEVESALVDHPAVAEAAVIGRTDSVKGQAIAAFVTIRAGHTASEDLKREIKAHVGTKIGPIARPDDLFFSADLPKTRSGKIMRRLLRDIAEGRAIGDTTTLADSAVVNSLKEQYENVEG
ncbi:MAG: acetate--CoA ligase [Chthonomonas sp.]|nr:acetate--CoA ligase [Chthonomonas sp.]